MNNSAYKILAILSSGVCKQTREKMEKLIQFKPRAIRQGVHVEDSIRYM